MMESLGEQVSLLGFGEALHGGDEFLTRRNRFFQRLVEAQAMALSRSRSPTRRGSSTTISQVAAGDLRGDPRQRFQLWRRLYAANRELVEWMKQYNSDPAHAVHSASTGPCRRNRTRWKVRDGRSKPCSPICNRLTQRPPPAQGDHQTASGCRCGLGSAGRRHDQGDHGADSGRRRSRDRKPPPMRGRRLALRQGPGIRLAVEICVRNCRCAARSLWPEAMADPSNALHDLAVARNLLEGHAAIARRESLDTLVSMRDAMAGDHLVYIAKHEGCGKVMVHLHNAHLRRTRTKLPWYEFWPTGAHLDQLFGTRFAVSEAPWEHPKPTSLGAGGGQPGGPVTGAEVRPFSADLARSKAA